MPLTDGLHDPLGGWFSVADCSCTDLKKKKRELEDFLEDGDIDGWPRIWMDIFVYENSLPGPIYQRTSHIMRWPVVTRPADSIYYLFP